MLFSSVNRSLNTLSSTMYRQQSSEVNNTPFKQWGYPGPFSIDINVVLNTASSIWLPSTGVTSDRFETFALVVTRWMNFST